MQTITFDYTKANGDTSERTLLAMGTPSNKYSGIDLSSLDPTLAAEFAAQALSLHDEYIAELKHLQAEYDLTHNYRQFLESGVSNLTRI